jgi:hypothetical protein
MVLLWVEEEEEGEVAWLRGEVAVEEAVLF